jgi:hypothetical protein
MRSCDANIAIKRATTSCAFAENVFYGYWKAQDQGDDALTAYSAVTEQSYPMSCTSGTNVVCRAGDGAEVRFPSAAIRAYTAENAAHYAATHDTGPSNPADGGSASPGDDGGSGGGSDCDPNYEGQCLDPNSPDYELRGRKRRRPRLHRPGHGRRRRPLRARPRWRRFRLRVVMPLPTMDTSEAFVTMGSGVRVSQRVRKFFDRSAARRRGPFAA